MTDPKVSIVLPFFNAERFLAETITSVFSQTYADWELLLVDDGSLDRGASIGRDCARRDPGRVRYLEHANHGNLGASASRNLGIREARGELIALLDSDDVWFPSKLERQVAIMDREKSVGLLCGPSEYWYSWTGRPEDQCRDFIVDLRAPIEKVIPPPTMLLIAHPLGEGEAPCVSSLMIRRSVLTERDPFEEHFRGIHQLYEDQVFLTRLYLGTSVFVQRECLDRYRIHPGSFMGKLEKPKLFEKARAFFLEWLEQYVKSRRMFEGEIRLALEKARWPHRHPVLRRLRDQWLRTVVIGIESTPPAAPFLGASIDVPKEGQRVAANAFPVEGWVIGETKRAVAVEIVTTGGEVMSRTPVEARRSDVAAAFRGRRDAESSGYRARLDLRSWRSGSIRVDAVFDDGSRQELGKIHFRRDPLSFVPPRSSRNTAAPPAGSHTPRVGGVRFGSLRRLTPISRDFGFSRGQPIDRYFIERFLGRNALAIRGAVLEIGDDAYTRRFGGPGIESADVLHIDPRNTRATIIGDLTKAEHIPSNRFDCAIVTQTLHHIYDVRSAIQTLHRILKPGGTLLVTLPGISQVARDEWGATWYWTFTTQSARKMFGEFFRAELLGIESSGNVLASISFLHGLAAEELRPEELEALDPSYELLITVRAVKAREPETGWRGGGSTSVIIPCFNLAHFLPEAIESAIDQSVPPQEILVVDDGSSDNAEQIAARYPRTRCIRQKNGGLSAALNSGIREASGEFLIFLDADDRLLPGAVEAGLTALSVRPDCGFVSGRHRLIHLDGSMLGDRPPAENPDSYVALLRDNFIGMHSTVMYRRGVFDEVGPFDETLPCCEDYEMYLRVARRFPICSHSQVVAEYRMRGAAMSTDPSRMLRGALDVLRRQRPFSTNDEAARSALRSGLATIKRRYGASITAAISESLVERRWRRVLAEGLVLLRNAPGEFVRYLRTASR